ncbi:MAG TPA: hypothetical protein VGN80_19115 [Devosiaceae bacterium]|jgi:hypothetical protein|nr:hypothetical protein [Devosiaceae bacterium]
MRRDLVERVLDAARERLFEDVAVKVGAAAPVTAEKAISGIIPATERFELQGQNLRAATHVTRGLKAALPALASGHLLIDADGTYRVIDIEPVGDGRFEIAIALTKVA